MKKLSVVFTFYNEHHCIESAVNEVSSVLNQYNEIEHELIFVNDCSNDNSLKVLLDLREKNKKIKIVNMSRRFGLFPCIMAGFRHTTGDAAIYLDVDLQDPPEIIHDMIKYWLKDSYDVVYTTRNKTSGNNFFLKMLSKVGYLILSKTSNIKVDVNTGDFKLITRKVINEYIKFNEIDPFHRLIIDYIGFKKKQIFYNRRQRIKGKSNFNLYDIIIKSFFEKTFAPFSDFPLRFALIFGFFSFVVCMFVLFRTLFLYLGGLSSQEISTTSIFVAILFFAGVQSLIIGFLAIYIGLIHKETKQRPVYIVDNTIGFEK
jgi:dolichol-phosphate mannosyltransferase